jgi:pimeloyl-ACP methyl ester carboxylesterase
MHVAEAGEGRWCCSATDFRVLVLVASPWHRRSRLPRGRAGHARLRADPAAVGAYMMMHLVGDMTGLRHPRRQQAVIVGPAGSLVAWNAALLRRSLPRRRRHERPFLPRMPVRPTMMKALAGDRFLYILYFPSPEGGPTRSARAKMCGMLHRVGRSTRSFKARPDCRRPPNSSTRWFGRRVARWLGEEDLEVYVGEFERSGFRGGLNWYRNFDRNWELLAPFTDLRVTVPALFVGGLRDAVVTGPEFAGESPTVQMLGSFCDDLRGKVLLEGIGHWNQQEAPERTNAAVLDFLAGLKG